MNTWRRSMGAALLVWAVALSLFTSPRATAQGGRTAPRSQAPRPTLRPAGAGKEPEARRLALERYRFLERLEPQFGGLPISEMAGDYTAVALFPVGRSDRVYLFLWGGDINYASCFQRKGSRDRLVYRFALDPVDRPPKRIRPVGSLLDYIRSAGNMAGSYAIHGRISRFARSDLALRQEYVIYCLTSMGDILEVGLLSDVESIFLAPWAGEQYDLHKDPVTGAKLTEDEFFRRHGLPVAKKERTLLSDARK